MFSMLRGANSSKVVVGTTFLLAVILGLCSPVLRKVRLEATLSFGLEEHADVLG